MTLDFRHPEWLNKEIPFVEDEYIPLKEIVRQLAHDPEMLMDFLITLSCSMANRQVSDIIGAAAEWVSSYNYCEHVDGPLSKEHERSRRANKMVLHWMKKIKAARSKGSGKFRRQ